jgi:ATP-binding cassette subfamily F protein 3
MIVLSAKDITKTYGVDTILSNISFHVNEGDRIGIISENGAGKTTLLKILTGESEASSGDVFVSQDITVGYLRQQDDFNSENTVMQEVAEIFRPLEEMEKNMLSVSENIAKAAETGEDSEALIRRYDEMQVEFETHGGYTYKSEMKGVLNSMAFTDDYFDKPVSMLSGGERTRLSLACLLLKKPNMLYLDEPTNHLDIGTLKWLEQYLKSYNGTILIVSHDRYFLDQTVNRIFEIDHKRLYIYEGNYSDYAKKRAARREEELRAFRKQQTEIDKQEEMIRRFRQHGTEKLAKRAHSREMKLQNMERIDRPEGEHGRMKIHFKENFESGRDVMHIEDLAKSFGYGSNKRELFRGVNIDIRRGEKICIVGANGIGKTTFMRIILGELTPNEGYIKKGHNVEFGYYDQTQQILDENKTVIDELHDAYRLYTDTEIRSILGRFLFRGDMVFLPIRSLSGGEKARLSLLKLMLSGANVLLLDEPTNHLDIDSKEIFEDALIEFPGTAIVVSHDRYFLGKVPTRIMELSAGGFTEYLGKYDYYCEKKAQIESGKKYLGELAGSCADAGSEDADAGGKPVKELSNAELRTLRKEQEARERREQREREALETEIEELEIREHDIEEEMLDEEVMNDYHRLNELNDELIVIKDKLSKKYQKWLQY